MLLDYKQAVFDIENIPRFAIKEPLTHAKEMLRRVGEPQNAFKVIHVAGTNGKGSVCAYLDAMFREGGFKCGLFTSPHLVKINERFKINGQDISDEEFLKLFAKVKIIIDEFISEGLEHPSYFEIVCVMGMLYFQEQDVDIAIVETGLGGRLDATNAVAKPLASVITTIGLDHTEILGDTLEEIAFEKAGIIKAGSPVIYEETNDAVASVIKRQAKLVGTNTYQLASDMYKITRKNEAGIDFSLHCKYYKGRDVAINSIASYQVANAALALLTMAVLKDFHQIPPAVLCRGIAKVNWPGRMETLSQGIILDGAHNEDGVLKFIETATSVGDAQQVTILFATVSDKNYQKMIHLISSKVKPKAVVTTQISGSRAIAAKQLAKLFIKAGCDQVYSNPDVVAAFERACELKGDGMLFCVGSLYMVGALKLHLENRTSKRKESYD